MTTPEGRENSARQRHLFDAEMLGNGNVDAGVNILASMALERLLAEELGQFCVARTHAEAKKRRGFASMSPPANP